MNQPRFKMEYIDNRKLVVGYILKNIFKPDAVSQAVELYQDAFLRYMEAAQKTNFQIENKLSTYLIGIVKNIQREKARAFTPDADWLNDFAKYTDTLGFDEEKEGKLQRIVKELSFLSENCKTIIHYFYFDKLSHQEIMTKMGFSSAEVSRTTLSRCIHTLKNKILK